MDKRIGLIVVVCCAFALLFCLAGCAGANVDKSLYTGEWTLVSSSDKNIDDASIQLMRSMNSTIDLTLNEDGSGTLKEFGGQTEAITWKATSNTEGTVSYEGEDLKMKLDDGKLTLTDSGKASMTFAKKDTISSTAASVTASSASASSESSSDASSSSESSEASDEAA